MALAPDALERLRNQLLARRAELVDSSHFARRGIQELGTQERGQEMEEGAQSSATAYVLQELSESQQREVGMIDDALQRMEAGVYGICEDCGATISEGRLRLVPFATRDAGCQSRAEAYEKALKERPSL